MTVWKEERLLHSRFFHSGHWSAISERWSATAEVGARQRHCTLPNNGAQSMGQTRRAAESIDRGDPTANFFPVNGKDAARGMVSGHR